MENLGMNRVIAQVIQWSLVAVIGVTLAGFVGAEAASFVSEAFEPIQNAFDKVNRVR